jgi:hypothetical protein
MCCAIVGACVQRQCTPQCACRNTSCLYICQRVGTPQRSGPTQHAAYLPAVLLKVLEVEGGLGLYAFGKLHVWFKIPNRGAFLTERSGGVNVCAGVGAGNNVCHCMCEVLTACGARTATVREPRSMPACRRRIFDRLHAYIEHLAAVLVLHLKRRRCARRHATAHAPPV